MDTRRRSWGSVILLILGVVWWNEAPTRTGNDLRPINENFGISSRR
jgi:hypothetical protein